MKEVTYGWYPSVHDIYKPKGRPSTHHLQCLYNFRGFQGQMVKPQPELFVKGVSSGTLQPPKTPQDLRQRSRSVPVLRPYLETKIHIPTPIQCWSKTLPETQWGVVGDHIPATPDPPSEVGWPLPRGSTEQKLQHQKVAEQKSQQELLQKQQIQQQQERCITEVFQSPQNALGFCKSSPVPSSSCSEAVSGLNWPVAYKTVPLRPQSSYSGQHRAVEQRQRPSSSPVKSATQGHKDIKSSVTPMPPNGSKKFSSKRPIRIQSATVHKEKASLPSRPVTAGSGRDSVQEQVVSKSPEIEKPPTRPKAPVPFAHDISDTVCHTEEYPELPESSCLNEGDYEKVVDKYGWRAQVHGDPYRLKKPMKRESYVVQCTEPDILPDPPTVYMETKEPFFYNTIPIRPLSFTVDKDWMSEVLLAKRLQLQKRDGGIKYNYKNFTFVY